MIEVIRKLTVITNPVMVFEVGEVHINGKEIIEIKQIGSTYEDHVHSEYVISDEDGEMIASVENAPVIVEYLQISEDDDLAF